MNTGRSPAAGEGSGVERTNGGPRITPGPALGSEQRNSVKLTTCAC